MNKNITEMTPYWIWLQLCLGAGASADNIVAYFRTPEKLYRAGKNDRRLSGVFTENQLRKLEKYTLDDAHKILSDCKRAACDVVTPDCDSYPELLKYIKNYPLVLYVLGDLNCLKNRMAVAMVGTRRASNHGLDIAGKLGASLARANVAVISGGAMGIDGASHLGVLSEDGITVAVLGCGFFSKYRDGVCNIRHEIAKKGAVITEYPPDTNALGRNFPIRNRIIAGLSYGTVVVEGALGSGSLITANLALEQGREVFAVPGDAISSVHTGTIQLIRDGATPVFSASDILGQFEFKYPDLIEWDKVEDNLLYSNHVKIDFSQVKYGVTKFYGAPSEPHEEKITLQKIVEHSEKKNIDRSVLSEDAKKIYDVFEKDSIHVDDFCRKTNLPLSKVLPALTELELLGIIKVQSGKRYILV